MTDQEYKKWWVGAGCAGVAWWMATLLMTRWLLVQPIIDAIAAK